MHTLPREVGHLLSYLINSLWASPFQNPFVLRYSFRVVHLQPNSSITRKVNASEALFLKKFLTLGLTQKWGPTSWPSGWWHGGLKGIIIYLYLFKWANLFSYDFNFCRAASILSYSHSAFHCFVDDAVCVFGHLGTHCDFSVGYHPVNCF